MLYYYPICFIVVFPYQPHPQPLSKGRGVGDEALLGGVSRPVVGGSRPVVSAFCKQAVSQVHLSCFAF